MILHTTKESIVTHTAREVYTKDIRGINLVICDSCKTDEELYDPSGLVGKGWLTYIPSQESGYARVDFCPACARSVLWEWIREGGE